MLLAQTMLEPITEDDLPRIAALMNRAYRGPQTSKSWNSEAGCISGDRTTEALMRDQMRAAPDALFLKWTDAESGDALGCVWLEPQDKNSWYLGSLAIEPLRQNDGLGKLLLGAAEQRVRTMGGNRIRMTVVNVREALIAWYLRRGYRLTGEREPFPYDDARFGTPMREDLSFVVLVKDIPALRDES